MEISDGQRRSRAVSMLTYWLRGVEPVSEAIHDISCILADEQARFAKATYYDREQAIRRFARACNIEILSMRDQNA